MSNNFSLTFKPQTTRVQLIHRNAQGYAVILQESRSTTVGTGAARHQLHVVCFLGEDETLSIPDVPGVEFLVPHSGGAPHHPGSGWILGGTNRLRIAVAGKYSIKAEVYVGQDAWDLLPNKSQVTVVRIKTQEEEAREAEPRRDLLERIRNLPTPLQQKLLYDEVEEAGFSGPKRK